MRHVRRTRAPRPKWCRTVRLVGARGTASGDSSGAARRRESAADRLGISVEERASYRLAVLRYNGAHVSKLPTKRNAIFEAHSRANLASARERAAAGEHYAPPAPSDAVPAVVSVTSSEYAETPRSASHLAAEDSLLGAGCAACRGFCCKQGEDHAFNRSSTMLRSQYMPSDPVRAFVIHQKSKSRVTSGIFIDMGPRR